MSPFTRNDLFSYLSERDNSRHSTLTLELLGKSFLSLKLSQESRRQL